jgi:hypothetical protein
VHSGSSLLDAVYRWPTAGGVELEHQSGTVSALVRRLRAKKLPAGAKRQPNDAHEAEA